MTGRGTRKKPLNLTKRLSRKLSVTQAYSRLYYEKKLKAIVDARWARHLTENPTGHGRGEALRLRNAVIKELFDAETEEVKADVKKKREEGSFSDEDIESDDDGEVEAIELQRRNRARRYQRKVLFFFFFLTHSLTEVIF
jgi:hypothetical protein